MELSPIGEMISAALCIRFYWHCPTLCTAKQEGASVIRVKEAQLREDLKTAEQKLEDAGDRMADLKEAAEELPSVGQV